MKTKIILIQLNLAIREDTSYKVVGLVNRTVPKIDTILSEKDVQFLISQTENLTVDIKPEKR